MKLQSCFLACLAVLGKSASESKSQNWTDISTDWIASQGLEQGKVVYNVDCGGVAVNRLNGDAAINVTLFGMWKTSDQGKTFERVDQNTVGGRCASAWSIQCDQDDPKRMAVFSLDGDAAYTVDGANWTKWTTQGRNWDLGAVNWDSPDAKVIFAARHEHGDGMLQLSRDGGETWEELSVKANMQYTASGVMVGVIDADTLIYSNNNGINRSTDHGKTWTKVADATTRNKVAVMFKGVCYVGTDKGLLVSKDKGATWETQGSAIDILHGPQFGADEKTMVIVNNSGMHKSVDAGATWELITPLTSRPAQYPIGDVSWFGRYAWDPINNVCYATAIGNPVFKKELGHGE
jgi:Uncharacterized protein related to plant photosystem II stability/assembly factor